MLRVTKFDREARQTKKSAVGLPSSPRPFRDTEHRYEDTFAPDLGAYIFHTPPGNSGAKDWRRWHGTAPVRYGHHLLPGYA
mmetsp:Transcript_30719/g.70792  ORF Transcript_30719/g.70792 Transcript_30719/m.70792 type:complete len:81 (+) Transcript_30719:799-1041(+)